MVTKKDLSNMLLVGFLLSAVSLSAGCEDDNALEEAGEDTEEALEDAGDEIEDAGDDLTDG